MGLNLNDYMTGADEVRASAGFDIPDGHYEWEVSDIRLQEGTSSDSEQNIIFIDYSLDNGQKKSDLFYLPKDPQNPSQQDIRSIARYKARLIDLGVPSDEVNTYDTDKIVGITGVFELSSTTKSGKTYQNIRNLKVHEKSSAPATLGATSGQQASAPATSAANPFAAR